MEENPEEKKTSKLSNLIEGKDNSMGSQYIIHYSENNWESSEEINIVLNDNATISQLIEESIYKFKNELFYDNIDKKQLIVRIFKKKKKIPNFEYPICNPNSKVKDFAKSHFCLVENKKEEEKSEENNKAKENQNKLENENGNKQENIKKNNNSIEKTNNTPSNTNSSSNSNIGQTGNVNAKNDKPSCRPCIII